MRSTGIANPAQLSILNQALDQHCTSHGIVDPEERAHIALMTVSLFGSGTTSLEDLLAGLKVATAKTRASRTSEDQSIPIRATRSDASASVTPAS